ncbi:MAG: hypothetical protein WEC80_01650 [Patescibacteria group bacterium]
MTVETDKKTLIDKFTQKDRRILKDSGFVIIKSKRRNLYDFEKEGWRFVTLFLENKNKVFLDRSRGGEIAYVPTGIYLPDSYRHSSYDEQTQLLSETESSLREVGLTNININFPSVADCMEVADVEAKKGINIFGYEFGYLYTRTSTENSPTTTVIIGCDNLSLFPEEMRKGTPEGEFRGIHILDYPKDNNLNSALFLIPVISPTQ